MRKLLIALLMVSGLISSGLQAKQPLAAVKARYAVLSEQGPPRLLTVWKSARYLALQFEGQSVIGCWQNWNSEHPTFYQVYPTEGYRIEFSQIESEAVTDLLNQLKGLLVSGEFRDRQQGVRLMSNQAYTVILSSLEQGKAIEAELNHWQALATYDYADIGDNEAVPGLAKLITQGFIRNF